MNYHELLVGRFWTQGTDSADRALHSRPALQSHGDHDGTAVGRTKGAPADIRGRASFRGARSHGRRGLDHRCSGGHPRRAYGRPRRHPRSGACGVRPLRLGFLCLALGSARAGRADRADRTLGKETFQEVGCEKCHLPSLRGPRGAIPAYTDLLLHDMGDELADGFPMGEATGREFRTQPLWGIAAASPYLHDGRARTLDEAIRTHGGEAASIRDAYVALSPAGRQDLIAFLESLGGRAQRNRGLVASRCGDSERGRVWSAALRSGRRATRAVRARTHSLRP